MDAGRIGGDMVRAADVAWCRRVGGAVAMAFAFARLAATKERFVEWDIEILVGTKAVAAVALPCLVTEHSLSAVEIIGSTRVKRVEILLLAIEKLRMEKRASQSRATTGKWDKLPREHRA